MFSFDEGHLESEEPENKKTGYGKYFKKGFAAVKVVYTAGYEAVPTDLKLAVFDLITYYLKDERKTQRSIAGTTLRNEGTTSIKGDVGFPDHIKRVLDLYKNF